MALRGPGQSNASVACTEAAVGSRVRRRDGPVWTRGPWRPLRPRQSSRLCLPSVTLSPGASASSFVPGPPRPPESHAQTSRWLRLAGLAGAVEPQGLSLPQGLLFRKMYGGQTDGRGTWPRVRGGQTGDVQGIADRWTPERRPCRRGPRGRGQAEGARGGGQSGRRRPGERGVCGAVGCGGIMKNSRHRSRPSASIRGDGT